MFIFLLEKLSNQCQQLFTLWARWWAAGMMYMAVT